MKNIADALKPYGYEWLLSATGIAGPGAMIVVFAGKGDFYTACLTHDDQVVWVMTCGGQEVDASIDEINDLHRTTREFYRLKKPSPFKVGESYQTQGGQTVRFIGIANENTDYETMFDEDGVHRYTTRDFGRVTGSPHDYSDPRNVPPPAAP